MFCFAALRTVALAAVVSLLVVQEIAAQQTAPVKPDAAFTNQTIQTFWSTGTSEAQLLQWIDQNPGNYSVTNQDMRALLDFRLPASVILKMADKMRQQAAQPPAAAPVKTLAPPAAPAKQLPPAPPAGTAAVYYWDSTRWQIVNSEEILWTNSGMGNNIKKWSSMGLKEKSVRGELTGPASYTQLTNPVEVIAYVPDGSVIQHFRIVPLTVKKGKRVVLIGGNDKADALSNSVQFSVEGTTSPYRIRFPQNFTAGEYGAFNITTTGDGVTQTRGRIYTFRVPVPQ